MSESSGRALDFPRVPQADSDPADLGLAHLIDIGRRRIWVFALVSSIVFAAVFVDTMLAQRLYMAQALVQIDVRRIEPLGADTSAIISGLPPDSAVIDTETRVLQSRSLAGKVVDDLALTRDREFNRSFDAARANAQNEREETIDAVLNRLEIAREGLTHIISVSFTSSDPAKAARIADAFAQGYLTRQLETKYEVIAQTNAWLSHRLDTLRSEVQIKEQAAERYRADRGLLTAEGASLNEQAIAQLNAELVAARADLAERRARLTAIRSDVQQDNAASTGEALASPVVADCAASRRRLSVGARSSPPAMGRRTRKCAKRTARRPTLRRASKRRSGASAQISPGKCGSPSSASAPLSNPCARRAPASPPTMSIRFASESSIAMRTPAESFMRGFLRGPARSPSRETLNAPTRESSRMRRPRLRRRARTCD